MTVYSQLVKFW